MNLKTLLNLPSLPKNTRISTRDFIYCSLYHPSYGYFAHEAQIFSSNPIPFQQLKDSDAVLSHLASIYHQMDKTFKQRSLSRQVWHTPSEMFKPWYGYILADKIIENHRDSELVIYEVGGGNGTLMDSILDRIKKAHPFLYNRTHYTLIDIYPPSHELKIKLEKHAPAKLVGQSIFDYQQVEHRACHVLAMEVVDNFTHDLVRYDAETFQPLQGMVDISEDGEFEEVFEPVSDSKLLKALHLKKSAKIPNHFKKPTWSLFPENLIGPEFIPTMTWAFLEQIQTNFKKHYLYLSDFDYLPEAVEGKNGPVVQTRLHGDMVPCSTYLVHPGYFDIFFPTQFQDLEAVYQTLALQDGIPVQTQVMKHANFFQNSPLIQQTQTQTGENPLIKFYQNMSFFVASTNN